MLIWVEFFLILSLLTAWSLTITTQQFLTMILTTEMIIIFLFNSALAIAIYVNINIAFIVGYILLILGGLEMSLTLLLLLL